MIPIKFFGSFYTKESLTSVIASFLTGGEGGHLWFLPALFWCFIIFQLILLICKDNNIYLPLVLSVFVFVVFSSLTSNFFYIVTAINYLVWFAVGYTFCLHRDKLIGILSNKKLIIAIFFLTIAVVSQQYIKFLNSTFTILLISFWLYLISLFLSKKRVILDSILLKHLDKNSFYVYIFHDPLEYWVLRFAFHYEWLTTSWGCCLYTFLRIFGVIIVSLVLGEAISKTKNILRNKCSKPAIGFLEYL